jgi:hypothetical protein
MHELQDKSNGEKSFRQKPPTIWAGDLPLERETCWFILVNALDVFLTFVLLYLEDFRESNIIASYVLERWGVTGMVYFKFGLVAFITVIAQVAARKKLSLGRWLLNFGTFLTGVVVVYSSFLLVRWTSQ